MNQKIIAVVGATGAQGGSLARAILADRTGGFKLRAITRKPSGDKAQELAKLGAEVVAADLDDVESLTRAFAGAHGAFCVTNFWEHFSPAKETQQGKNLGEATRRAGVAHAIWSTFEDTRQRIPLADGRMPTLQGHYKVPHFDAKADADGAFERARTTFLYTSFYWDNLIGFGMGPKKGPDGKLAFTLPTGSAKLPGIAAEDIGKCAYGIFKRGSEMLTKTVGVAGEHLTGAEMASALAMALEQPVAFNAVSPEVYRGFGFPGADDLGNMFQFKRDFEGEFCRIRDLALCRALNPELMTFAKWLSQNKTRIPL